MDKPALFLGYPDHMVFSEFRRRFDVLAPHLTKKHGRNYIVVDERRVGLGSRSPTGPPSFCPDPSKQLLLVPSREPGCSLLRVLVLATRGQNRGPWPPSCAGREKVGWGVDCRDRRRATVFGGQSWGSPLSSELILIYASLPGGR